MKRAAISTFEELTLRVPDETPTEEQASQPVTGSAVVHFVGDASGFLAVQVRGGVLVSIASAMLGTAAEHDVDIQLDALGELANVLCGNLVTAVAGQTAEINLHAPIMRNGTGLARPRDWLRFGLDDGCIELSLNFLKVGTAS